MEQFDLIRTYFSKEHIAGNKQTVQIQKESNPIWFQQEISDVIDLVKEGLVARSLKRLKSINFPGMSSTDINRSRPQDSTVFSSRI